MLQLTHTHSQLENPALPPDAAVTRGLTLKTCNEQQASKNQNRHEPPHIYTREKICNKKEEIIHFLVIPDNMFVECVKFSDKPIRNMSYIRLRKSVTKLYSF